VTSVLLAIDADKTLTTQTRAYAPRTPKGSEAHHISWLRYLQIILSHFQGHSANIYLPWCNPEPSILKLPSAPKLCGL